MMEGPFLAVDRRLAEQIRRWSTMTYSKVFLGSHGQFLPSFLILYGPKIQAPLKQTLEIQALEICVRWTSGVKPKETPDCSLITNTGVPKNARFCESLWSISSSGGNGIPISCKSLK